MATQQEKDLWIEIAQDTGVSLEAGVQVLALNDMDESVSIPGVVFPDIRYDASGNVTSLGRPNGYCQLPLGTLQIKTRRADAAAQAAEDAVDDAVAATTEASRVNAVLDGMTVTITDRQGQSRSTKIGFDIYRTYASRTAMNADAANVGEGKFVMITTTDVSDPDNATLWGRNDQPATSQNPFTFLSDLDQASSAAWADWLDNLKPTILADHNTAVADHTTASTDHTTAQGDHTTAIGDHTTASSDHTASTTATNSANAQANRAKAWADHPPYIGNGTTGDLNYWYLWKENIQNYVRDAYAKGDNLDWDTITPAEKERLIQEIVASLTFASQQTCRDIVSELI